VATVLLVEDDRDIAEPLARVLRREQHRVEVVSNGATAAQLGVDERFDLVILDLGLPDLDGLEVCRQLRAAHRRLPILILTARASEVDAVVGLDAGADDYVTKPFGVAELLARARALLRRGTVPGDGDDRGGEAGGGTGVRIDREARRAWSGDTELDLTAKEFDLLHALMSEAGSVVTRERLIDDVWDIHWSASTKTLDMHISSLRRKLGDNASSPRYISTVRGVGYRFESD